MIARRLVGKREAILFRSIVVLILAPSTLQVLGAYFVVRRAVSIASEHDVLQPSWAVLPYGTGCELPLSYLKKLGYEAGSTYV